MLMAACIGAVLYFRESRNMEVAFGLSVTITMLVTTFLITGFMIVRRRPMPLIILTAALFLTVEISFLIANIQKLAEGGWIMVVAGGILIATMLIWYRGKETQQKLIRFARLPEGAQDKLVALSHDNAVPMYATNLIYLTSSARPDMVEQKVLNSIMNIPVKRADLYWFLHVHITDEPYTMTYEVNTLSANDVYHVTMHLGFRVEPRVDLFFRKIAEELVASGEVAVEKVPGMQYSSTGIGNYKFVITNSFLSYDNDLPLLKNVYTRLYYLLKSIGIREDEAYGLDSSNVLFEKYPLVFNPADQVTLRRIHHGHHSDTCH